MASHTVDLYKKIEKIVGEYSHKVNSVGQPIMNLAEVDWEHEAKLTQVEEHPSVITRQIEKGATIGVYSKGVIRMKSTWELGSSTNHKPVTLALPAFYRLGPGKQETQITFAHTEGWSAREESTTRAEMATGGKQPQLTLKQMTANLEIRTQFNGNVKFRWNQQSPWESFDINVLLKAADVLKDGCVMSMGTVELEAQKLE